MSVLLDTHIWIWWLTGQADLPEKERSALDERASHEPPLLSAISMWEAQMLHGKRRLQLALPFASWLVEATLPEVVRISPVTPETILALDPLPDRFHGDPADRIIVAAAISHGVPLYTYDVKIRRARVVSLYKP